MDLHLLALLLLFLCKQGWTDEASEEGKIPLVPLIPLIPGKPITDLEPSANGTTPEPSAGEEEDSSEGGLDGVCGPGVSRLESKLAIGSGIMNLGLKFLVNLKTGPGRPNVIISPLSLSLALSQLALGARNETEKLLFEHLHADALPCYHKSLSHLLKQFRKSTFQIATRMYLRQGFQAKEEFIKESVDLYGSDPATLTGLEEVNEWVENATNGQIVDFLSSLPPNIELMLINAVHYKGEWLTRFDPRFTSTEPFHIDDKQVVNVDMMLGPKHPLSVFTHNELDAQVARLPFKGDKSLLVVLPISGQVNVSAMAAKLNISDLYSRFPREISMQVRIPKLKLDFGEELEDVMTKMGLGELFSGPNLAGIAESPLLVSSVQHKSSMEINEEGAEAAATTSVSISRSNPSFTVNQPFFLALMDDSTQTPLFLGVITNPNPGAAVVVRAALMKSLTTKDKMGFGFDKNYDYSFGTNPK
ncbi:serpin peptidase inhibitor, clade F (alpha-2 antiplasmin, pigment epithelium derived factor), member 2b isoform X2 [Chanos chanos]|uniref:Serpin peptidase inhibitor, clade F (Alpha-2 antiplasmin, pigment epithelium derived factor), member 2b isoform X2 n=1 Tax=Chanos chanos TaxID=29144 RepID=A0A6J2VNT2_CHACN|nr:alpha-2-antiplasmin isoform X2 [Chanos chanos]